jgi:hypothetical protein
LIFVIKLLGKSFGNFYRINICRIYYRFWNDWLKRVQIWIILWLCVIFLWVRIKYICTIVDGKSSTALISFIFIWTGSRLILSGLILRLHCLILCCILWYFTSCIIFCCICLRRWTLIRNVFCYIRYRIVYISIILCNVWILRMRISLIFCYICRLGLRISIIPCVCRRQSWIVRCFIII